MKRIQFIILIGSILSILMIRVLSNPIQIPTCGTSPQTLSPQISLPKVVTGRVGFYAAIYKNGSIVPSSAVALGEPSSVFPTASMFKTLVVYGAMQAVDSDKLRLEQKFKTTRANRSIEAYPRGSNTLLELAKLSIDKSDNTASHIIHLAVDPTKLATSIQSKSPCTIILLTSKAYWAAQAGLLSSVLGKDTLNGARVYAESPFKERLQIAARLNAATLKVTGPAIEQGLERYFHGSSYSAQLELWLQNTTTPKAYTDLLVNILSARDLKPNTRKIFRDIMKTGCCISRFTPLRSSYRGAKAGSGWRILTLSGYADLSNGLSVAYTYMNDQSKTLESENMEKQIRVVNHWIDQILVKMAGQK